MPETTEKKATSEPPGKTARIISVFGPKGGVGTSVIATNLATTFRVHLNSSTALIDLSISQTAPTLLGKTDVHCLAEEVSRQALPALIEARRGAFAFVVIDAGSILTETVVAAFERSNLILLVTTPDVVSIRQANYVIELLDRMQFPLRMVRVVINRAESHGNLRSRDVKAHVPVPVVAEIPSDGRVVGFSVNQGMPVVLSPESSRVKDLLRRLARTLIETPRLFVEQCVIDRSTVTLPTRQAVHSAIGPSNDSSSGLAVDSPLAVLKRKVHTGLIEHFDLKRLDLKTFHDPNALRQLRERAEKVALDLILREGGMIAEAESRQQLVKEIVDETLGFGPLEDLLADGEVSDVLVNGKDMIYVEKHGKLSLTEKRFTSNEQLLTVIERIIAPLGRRIDESTPMVDARLPDGSRVNAIIAPLSLKGPILSIRKFSRERYTIDDLIRFGTLDRRMADFLGMCVRGRKNIIVSGGTGSGKTTFLNVLSSFIPSGERIVTIEDAAELRLHQEHWVALEARPPNVEGRGSISIRQLFHNALRMRPDRIVIGECRGDETLDMLQAMNTGHDGSLTTLHANSPQDVITRLDSLVLMSNVDLPARAIREQIASAIHLIVHTARLSDGSRKVTHITELSGMDDRADVRFQDLFVFRQSGVGADEEVQGAFQPTGVLPTFLEQMRTFGIAVDKAMFDKTS
ncbi:MAG: Flp pilus assembly complex ATPase component TadA [Candidatus Omnitrophica bacterium]|nr:Flp pilus assembly complex ATPase component TadA [Candidatus Omnitrophota bacterium]